MKTEMHVVCKFENEVTIPVSLIEEMLEISWTDVKSFNFLNDSLQIEMKNGNTHHYCLVDDIRYMTETAKSVEIENL